MPSVPFPAAAQALFAEACRLYPHEDPARAFRLFFAALSMAPDVGPDEPSERAVQDGDIGFAAWALWVVHDLAEVGEPSFSTVLALVQRKSPRTAQEIVERLAENERRVETSERMDAAAEDVLAGGDLSQFGDSLSQIERDATATREWWRVRDLAASLAAAGQVERSELAFESALRVATSIGRAPATIHSVRADMKVARGDFSGAALDFLRAVAAGGASGAKANPEKFRRALSKAGLGRGAKLVAEGVLARLQVGDLISAEQELRTVVQGLSPKKPTA